VNTQIFKLERAQTLQSGWFHTRNFVHIFYPLFCNCVGSTVTNYILYVVSPFLSLAYVGSLFYLNNIICHFLLRFHFLWVGIHTFQFKLGFCMLYFGGNRVPVTTAWRLQVAGGGMSSNMEGSCKCIE